jgi:HEPN domain-containing protein
MDFYLNAVETEASALALFNAKKYRHAIYLYCLAIELYLKSRLYLVEYDDDLNISHDIGGLYDTLVTRFKPSNDLHVIIKRSRKYFNESRYPYGGDFSAYTREFAEEFIETVKSVKQYVDNECVATEDDLKRKFSKEQ